MSEMLLSPEEFKSRLIELQLHLNNCDAYNWHFHQCDPEDDSTAEIYIKMPAKLIKEISTVQNNNSKDEEEEEATTLVLSKSVIHEDTECTSKWEKSSYDGIIEYRIGFSQSFEVPVLYMRGQASCGSQLGLQEVWNLFKSATGVDDKKILWEAVTQVEHPYLHLPYFRIHPCKTGQLMSKLEVTRKNFLLLWLSVCGPMIGLQLPLISALNND